MASPVSVFPVPEWGINQVSSLSMQEMIDKALAKIEPGHIEASLKVDLGGVHVVFAEKLNDNWSVAAVAAWLGPHHPIEGGVQVMFSR